MECKLQNITRREKEDKVKGKKAVSKSVKECISQQ